MRSQFHDELREKMRVIVLHVQRRQLHAAVTVRYRHDLDDLRALLTSAAVISAYSVTFARGIWSVSASGALIPLRNER